MASTKKYVGSDTELSTTGITPLGDTVDPWRVTKHVLREIDTTFQPFGTKTWTRRRQHRAYDGYASARSIDCLRHWAPNGQCFYSDMSHVEVCTASTLFPRQYAAQCLSTLLVAEAGRERAELELGEGAQYSLATANIDVLDPSIAWGSHISVSVAPHLWEDLLQQPRHPAVLGFVASAFAAAIPFFGAGYLLPMKDGSVVYSLSGRAHHLSRIVSHSTTDAFRRGLLNSRREPHGHGHDRLHLIGFDFGLASAALKCSFLQCCLAAAEEGSCGLNVYDPVRALRSWSWGLDPQQGLLRGEAALTDRRSLTLSAYMRELCEMLLRMHQAGLIREETAPQAGEMLQRIIDLTHYIERGELTRCAAHLDWAAKLLYLTDIGQQQGEPMEGPIVRLADHDFANTDPRRGAFWRFWEMGLVDPLISRDDVEACLQDGPEDSRAWGRGRIIQKFSEDLTDVDWHYVEMRRSNDPWGNRLRIEMPRLDSLGRQAFESVVNQANSVESLEMLLGEDEDAIADEADPMDDIRSQLAIAPRGPENRSFR